MSIQKLRPEKGSTPSRLWFMSRGYRKHPNYNLWAHEGEAYFLSAYGNKLAHRYSPAMRKKQTKRGYVAPCMRHFGSRLCHILMGEIFYGERPIFIDRHGKPYVGICHHLIEDPLDYRPENLLCWLTREQHVIADRRQRALRKLVPDLHAFPIERLRILEDPRVTTDEQFEFELEQLRPGFVLVNPAVVDDLEPNKYYDPFIERD